jgi:hypothetical protein
VLNPQASTLSPGAAAVRSAVLRIEHREPTVRCQATFVFDSKTFEYSLERMSDGRAVVDRATNFGFNVVTRPNANPYVNQTFESPQ